MDLKRMIDEAADGVTDAEFDRACRLEGRTWEGLMRAIDHAENELGEPLTERVIKLAVGWALNAVLEQRELERREQEEMGSSRGCPPVADGKICHRAGPSSKLQ